jgi:hypothetical protein
MYARILIPFPFSPSAANSPVHFLGSIYPFTVYVDWCHECMSTAGEILATDLADQRRISIRAEKVEKDQNAPKRQYILPT